MQNITFQVQRDKLADTRLISSDISPLQPGQVLLKIDQFALTANNITYGVVGDQMGYWHFFPAEDHWGILPVWGLADVVKSQNEKVAVGERFYGYYPMSEYLVVKAANVNAYGFLDVSAHRKALPLLYNRYSNVAQEAAYANSSAALQMIFRPLFITAFLLDDMLLAQDLFQAKQVVLTSASSKTAFTLALLLARHAERDFKIIGFTSKRNVGFVNGLDCYDTVIEYENLNELSDILTVIVDFSGNRGVLLSLQKRLANHLKFTSKVGMVHHDQRDGDGEVKGEFFFAPAYAEQRLKDWTAAGFQERSGAAWQHFLAVGGNWLTINKTLGLANLDSIYQKVLNGTADAKIGQIVRV
ncbi:MAG: DUF2855 family protein [Bacteroidota bacterium]